MSKAIILVVDDNVALADTIGCVLEAKGYHITVAHDGLAAVALAKKTHFDIALMDIKMPGMNGVEAYKEIKKVSPGTQAIMMTGYSVPDLIEEAMREGVYEVMSKPFDPDRLLALIEGIDEKDSMTAGGP